MIMKNEMESEKIETAMAEKNIGTRSKQNSGIHWLFHRLGADGVVHFYEDVYKRDEALASLLFDK
jgi:murein L,D-transpeptidase YcbB/YkuD